MFKYWVLVWAQSIAFVSVAFSIFPALFHPTPLSFFCFSFHLPYFLLFFQTFHQATFKFWLLVRAQSIVFVSVAFSPLFLIVPYCTSSLFCLIPLIPYFLLFFQTFHQATFKFWLLVWAQSIAFESVAFSPLPRTFPSLSFFCF